MTEQHPWFDPDSSAGAASEVAVTAAGAARRDAILAELRGTVADRGVRHRRRVWTMRTVAASLAAAALVRVAVWLGGGRDADVGVSSATEGPTRVAHGGAGEPVYESFAFARVVDASEVRHRWATAATASVPAGWIVRDRPLAETWRLDDDELLEWTRASDPRSGLIRVGNGRLAVLTPAVDESIGD